MPQFLARVMRLPSRSAVCSFSDSFVARTLVLLKMRTVAPFCETAVVRFAAFLKDFFSCF